MNHKKRCCQTYSMCQAWAAHAESLASLSTGPLGQPLQRLPSRMDILGCTSSVRQVDGLSESRHCTDVLPLGQRQPNMTMVGLHATEFCPWRWPRW